jgi:hypothetical protein
MTCLSKITYMIKNSGVEREWDSKEWQWQLVNRFIANLYIFLIEIHDIALSEIRSGGGDTTAKALLGAGSSLHRFGLDFTFS